MSVRKVITVVRNHILPTDCGWHGLHIGIDRVTLLFANNDARNKFYKCDDFIFLECLQRSYEKFQDSRDKDVFYRELGLMRELFG